MTISAVADVCPKGSIQKNLSLCPVLLTLVVLGDCYDQAQQVHQLGVPWLFDLDPEVFPIYLGLPWVLAVGPLPNIPWPAQIHTRICQPITFEYYGYEASRDRAYVQCCYDQVVETMQKDLNTLIYSPL